MKIRVPHYFNDFKCIADKCESTCCANWEVVIDDESLEKYNAVKGPFKDVLQSKITTNSENENIFLLNKNRCSFLNSNNTCDLYINLGKDSLCYTCSQYPRFIEQFLDLKEMGLSLSCPEAARIILKEDKALEFIISSNEEVITDIPSDFDKKVLNELLLSRNLIFKILNDSHISFNKKITIILSFVNDLQIKIDLGDMEEIPDVIKEYEEFLKDGFIEKVLTYIEEETLEKSFKKSNQFEQIHYYLNVYKDFKQIDNTDPLNINSSINFIENNKLLYLSKRNDFNDYFKENNYAFKNILAYFIYRYFLKGFFDFDLSSKIKISVVSLLIIRELSIIQWVETGTLTNSDFVKILYTYSKNIEHLEENIDVMQDIFETKDDFKILNILNLLDFDI